MRPRSLDLNLVMLEALVAERSVSGAGVLLLGGAIVILSGARHPIRLASTPVVPAPGRAAHVT